MTQPRLDTFIVVHDQQLLLRCETEGRYRHLEDPRFVFVGDGPTELICGRDDVVIARELADHLEDRPELLAFTAWYAVARNGLVEGSHAVLLEYDVDIGPDFVDSTLRALTSGSDALVGYLPLPLTDGLFAGTDAPFTSALGEVYAIDVDRLVLGHLTSTGSDLWTTTSNLSLSREALDEFVDWYRPIADSLAGHPLVGHVHERCLAVFGMLTGRPIRTVPRVLWHRAARSHGVDVEVMERRAPGTRRLPMHDDDPLVSLVVLADAIDERLLGLLDSLREIDELEPGTPCFEVVVVDDGSRPPLDGDAVRTFGPHVRFFHRGSLAADPMSALDFGVEMSRGARLGLVSQPTGAVSPGLVRWASTAVGHFPSSFVMVPNGVTAGRPGESAIFSTRERFVEVGGFDGATGVIQRGERRSALDAAGPDAPPPVEETIDVITLTVPVAREPASAEGQVRFGPGNASQERRDLEYAFHVIADRDAQLHAMRSSTSWKVTRPLRAFTGLLQGLATRR